MATDDKPSRLLALASELLGLIVNALELESLVMLRLTLQSPRERDI